MSNKIITQEAILQYEVKASWWAGRINNPRLQLLSAKYFAWKVNRKYRRYSQSEDTKRRLKWYYGDKQ